MARKTFQQWCIDTIVHILQEKNKYHLVHGDQGYKYVLKAIISHYASMYYTGVKTISRRRDGSCRLHLNLWWDHLNSDNARYFFTPLIVSKNAHAIYANFLNCTMEGFSKERERLKKELHLEHITPTEYIYDKLENLSRICESCELGVKRCFDQNKLVLITKEEKEILDGKGSRFEERDLKFLLKHFHQLGQRYWQEFAQLIGRSPKSQGLGLLRMARLYNSGVRFDYGATGKVVQISKWLSYLNDHNNIILGIAQP